jgi:hypothetical protein
MAYSGIAAVLTAMTFVTTWTPAQLLGSWSAKARVILILGFVCFGLILFIIATVDGARRIHLNGLAPLQQQIRDHEWLVAEAARDRDDVGQGVAITECEVSLDLACSKPFAEFIFYFFNGSLYPVAVEMELDGYVRFSDGATVIDLQDRPERIEKKSFYNTREEHDRYVRGEFIIVQKLSGADVDFMSSKRSREGGFFIFDNLTVSVRRENATDGSRLRLNDVRPRLRNTFRLDSSALAAKRELELVKIHKLEVIRGLALQLWDELQATGNATPEKVFREWEKRTMTYLTENYGEQTATQIYARCTHEEPFPILAPAQAGWLQQFFAEYQYFVDEEKKSKLASML